MHLIDRDPALVRAWREVFRDRDEVTVHEDDYFAHPAAAMVSPANSFGIMDGGLDLAIRNSLASRSSSARSAPSSTATTVNCQSVRPSSSTPAIRDGRYSSLRRPCASPSPSAAR